MFEVIDRTLTPAERDLLTARAHEIAHAQQRIGFRTLVASAIICAVLGTLTVIVSDAPPWVIGIFWLVMTGVFAVWIRIDQRRALGPAADAATAAAAAVRAREFHVSSAAVVEFEEIEDEGACYAFAIDDARMVFLIGQEFYEDKRFPNDDFSIVEALDHRGNALHGWTDCRGRKMSPARVVPATVKQALILPEPLEIVDGTVADIEHRLARR